MAINPNTTFSDNTVLTADQMNRLPRGVFAYAESSANAVIGAVEAIQLTVTFTAVANLEPAANPAGGAGAYFFFRVRLTNLAGTELQRTQLQESGATGVANIGLVQSINTFAAGSTTVVATVIASGAGSNLFRSAGSRAFLLVEDIGPA
jgi:hypothetical protein